MKSKKSAGYDEVTQEQLIMGAEVLAVPLTWIINTSITEGVFPEVLKEGIVTQVLKKGNPMEKQLPLSKLSVCDVKSAQEGCMWSNYTNDEVIEPATMKTFVGDATRLWNKTGSKIRQAKSNGIAQKEIKNFCLSLPIWNSIFSLFLIYKSNSSHLRKYIITYSLVDWA